MGEGIGGRAVAVAGAMVGTGAGAGDGAGAGAGAEAAAPTRPPSSGIALESVASISTPPSTRRLDTIKASGPRASLTSRIASRVVIPKNLLIFTRHYSRR